MKYMIDIDGTICNNTWGKYEEAQPYKDRIAKINKLYEDGHEIHFWTARGTNSGIDWFDLTQSQLAKWGVRYNTIRLGKPSYDIWVDDKAFNDKAFFDG